LTSQGPDLSFDALLSKNGGLPLKTLSARPQDVERHWYVVDAASAPLGRLASRVATILRGKHKPSFTPHVDTGDHVIVVNADHLVLTGQKMQKKVYRQYSGYQSGMRERTAAQQMALDSRELVRDAVKGMLPKTRLGRQMINKLKIYSGTEHPHAAQKPENLTIES
jgi:large subunit ribosomal protein L13